MSTEATVRDKLVTAIQGIAVTKLGFRDTNGNVQNRLLDFAGRLEEAKLEFLMAYVAGKAKKQLRCWAVQVTAEDDLFADFASNLFRTYDILIRGYYWPDDVNTAIDGARYIREAIQGLSTTLDGEVDRTLIVAQRPPTIELAPDAAESTNMCVIDLEMQAEKKPADFS